ncbi:MAG: hypothetical protein H7177_17395 [Rhizobacter sp.]|nr:hypothetical protein [Bacteriovorax sp.]
MNVPVKTNAIKRKLELDKKLKQIEGDELRLKSLEQELVELQMRVASEASPIVKEFCETRVENLYKLKLHLTDSEFKKKEKRLITNLMIELAFGLQSMGDARAEAFLDELMPEDFATANGDRESESEEGQQFRYTPPVEKQSEGTIEIKTLFRQLAKAFHPDREQEEHLKEEKTALMKKITAAYENQDLYGLLKLEKEHLAPREFSEDKIELYIKHINDRLKELKFYEATLKKHGPLSTIYKMIYSRKPTMQEYNIKNELSKIENEVEKEKELQQIIWDRTTLLRFFSKGR